MKTREAVEKVWPKRVVPFFSFLMNWSGKPLERTGTIKNWATSILKNRESWVKEGTDSLSVETLSAYTFQQKSAAVKCGSARAGGQRSTRASDRVENFPRLDLVKQRTPLGHNVAHKPLFLHTCEPAGTQAHGVLIAVLEIDTRPATA